MILGHFHLFLFCASHFISTGLTEIGVKKTTGYLIEGFTSHFQTLFVGKSFNLGFVASQKRETHQAQLLTERIPFALVAHCYDADKT